MERFRILPAILILTALAAGLPAAAQTAEQAPFSPQPHQRQTAPQPMLFSLGEERPAAAAPVEFRSVEQMTRQDRDLEADGEAAIAERAGFADLEFNQGHWNYRQVICSALPHHLFLQFTRNNGAGDVSVFSASVPRGGEGRVRIIPIVRRGYSLFSPAPINELTISAFNHIRAEEQSEQAPDWLATGLCYAALAGAHARIAPPPVDEAPRPSAVLPGSLLTSPGGGAIISFTDLAALPRPMLWTMTFDRHGKLLKATHSAAPKANEKDGLIVRTPVEPQGKLVPQSAEPKGRLVPQPQGELKGKPVPAQ